MISKVTISNFQGIGNEIEIPLSKLNLFFGPNAAGKSSISRALKLFGSHISNHFPPKNGMAFAEVIKSGEIGEFENYVHNHNVESTISIEWKFDLELATPKPEHFFKFPNWQTLMKKVDKYYSNSSSDFLTQPVELPSVVNDFSSENDLGGLDIEPVSRDDQSTQKFNVDARIRLEISAPGIVTFFGITTESFYVPSTGLIVPSLSLNMATQYEYPQQVWALEPGSRLQDPLYFALFNELIAISKKATNDVSYFASLKNKTMQAAIDNQWIAYDEGGLSWYFSSLNEDKWEKHQAVYNEFESWQLSIYDALREQMSMNVVGPLREIPESILEKNNEVFRNTSGLLGKYDKIFGYHLAREWFQRLTNGFDFEVTPLMANGLPTNHLKLDLITPSKVRINFRDAGVGLGQILPVLVYLFPNDDSLLKDIGAQVWIEQPEIHLHPKMQGELADAFIQHAKNYIFNRQLFIETHSENLVLRLLRRIRETNFGIGEVQIFPEDVSIIFVGHNGKETEVTFLEILETGEFVDDWPLDFVEIRMDDIL